MSESNSSIPKQTRLYTEHVALAAKMVPFAGYDMPVSYEGVLAEHLWTRSHCGLFDVSHMGQARLTGAGAAVTIENLTATDTNQIKLGTQKYGLLLAEDGGILDDWMISRPDEDGFFLVVNAGCKDQDFDIIEREKSENTYLEILKDRSLLALQGPKAHDVMKNICPQACALYFMQTGIFGFEGTDLIISRSGYTGEDGFEISVPSELVEILWQKLLSFDQVKPIGLGARDSLRLEAGMPLYGHDMDEGLAPFEAALGFGVSKSRLDRGDIRGHDRHLAQKQGRGERIRVGFHVHDGPPAREGSIIKTPAGETIGRVTSGGPSPSLKKSIAMGYVTPDFAAIGASLLVETRGKSFPATVVPFPFVPNSYHRKPSI
jgi:aminomethyltransferase